MLSRANRVLPEGLQVTGCEALPEGAPSLGKSVAACRYRLRRLLEMPRWPVSRAGLGELAAGVLEWRVEGDELAVTLDARQAGGRAVSVKGLLAVLGIAEEARRLVHVVREAVLLETRPVVAA
jgi:uncharacterized protein YecE (DUF72 family)